MADRLHQHSQVLRLLANSDLQLRRGILKNCDNAIIHLLCAVALNILKRNCTVTPAELSTLRTYRQPIHDLANQQQSTSAKRTLSLKPTVIVLLPLLLRIVFRSLDNGELM